MKRYFPLLVGVLACCSAAMPLLAGEVTGRFYWGNRNKIQSASLDGSEVTTIVSHANGDASGIDVDPAAGKIYWADSSWARIRRADADGSNVEELPIATGNAYSVRLDLTGDKVYWSDRDFDFSWASLDGTDVETLSTPTRVNGLDLDLVHGHIYWGSVNGVYRANLDGSEPIQLVSSGGVPRIRLDVNGGKMYWTSGDSVLRADLDGGNSESLVTGLNNALGVDLDLTAGKLYWTDNLARQIGRSNLDGSDKEILVTLPEWNANPLDLRVIPIPEPATGLLIVLVLSRACPRRERRDPRQGRRRMTSSP